MNGFGTRWSRSGAAFTLVELLVVVAIIALLVSILVPSLTKAKDLTRRAICLNNLHGLGVTFHFYAQDKDGWLPTRLLPGSTTGLSHSEWFRMYVPYLRKKAFLDPSNLIKISKAFPIFDCPATKGKVSFFGPGMWQSTEKTFDYIIVPPSESLGTGWPARMNLWQLKGDEVLLVDSKADNAWYTQGSGSSPDDTSDWMLNTRYIHNRNDSLYSPGWHHSDGANILFSDNHATWYERASYQPNYMNAGAGQYNMKFYMSQAVGP